MNGTEVISSSRAISSVGITNNGNLSVSENITNGTNIFNTNISTRNVGIGTTSPTAFLHVNTDRGNSPEANGILVYNTVNNNSSAHAYCSLRTNGGGGGNPCISMDVAGVAGWSMFVDNSDSRAFKIRAGWDQVGTEFLNLRREDNTIRTSISFMIPKTIISMAERGSSGSWTSGTALLGSYLSGSVVVNQTLNSTVNGIRPSGYVAPVSGMYLATFTARFQDNTGLVSLMPRVGSVNVLPSDFFIESDGAGRRCCSFSQMLQLNANGNAYDIFSTNGNNIVWGRFSINLISAY